MTSTITKLAPEILDAINKSSKILLHCHPYPDSDSLGSVLSMTSVLKKMGKEVTPITGDSKIIDSLAIHPNIEWLQSKSYSEIESHNFDLFIILDSSSKNQISTLTSVDFPKDMKTIVVDHHKTNQNFGDINLVDEISSSTCQVLYSLFNLWGVEIDEDIALNLFLGIFADTGGFKYQNCSPETMSIVAKLVKIKPDYHKYIFSLENNRKPIELEMMGLALSSTERHFSDKVVLSAIPYSEIKKRNLSRNDAADGLIPDILRSVQGWDLVASLVEVEPEVVIVSLRTRDENVFDVSDIAKSVGENGGGHRGAAGTTIHKTLNEAKKILLDYIAMTYPTIIKDSDVTV